MTAKAMMANLGQHRIAPATPPCEEQLEKAPEVVFRMESGSSDPDDTPQEKIQRCIPSKLDAESSQKLSENKRMVRKWPPPAFSKQDSELSFPQRRQEQNRSSQRAFRLRRETHMRSLRDKLGELHKTHRSLCQSYMKKCEEVDQLNTHVSKLSAEILQLQVQAVPQSGSEIFLVDSFGTPFCDFTPIDSSPWRPKWDSDATTWYCYQ